MSRRLADKLAAEAAAYQEELKGLATTPDQRRAALEKRATELFNKRESERASYAAEAAYRSWRERSDDLRTADTLARAREAAQMQLEQMQVRRRGEAEEAAKELEWAALSERERQRAEARHQAEVAARVKYMKEIKAIRDSQLEDIAQARQLNAAARAREITALKAKWAADDAAADAAARAAIQAAKDRAEVLAKANAERLAAKAAIRAAERALDDAIAAAAVRKAQEEEAAERLLVEAKKNSDAAYRTELAASRQRKAESEAHWEAVMQAHNAAVNAARDAAKRKEDEARAALMADVMATNAAQLQHKAQLRAEAEEAERQKPGWSSWLLTWGRRRNTAHLWRVARLPQCARVASPVKRAPPLSHTTLATIRCRVPVSPRPMLRQCGRLHRQVLSSATAVVVGAPGAGSWAPRGNNTGSMVLPHRCLAAGTFPQQQQRGASSSSGAARGSAASRLPGTAVAAALVLASTAATAPAAADGRPGGEAERRPGGEDDLASPGSVLPHKVDHYNGVIVDANGLPDGEQAFVSQLGSSLVAWKAEGRRGVWLQVPLDKATFVGLAVQAGFTFHHAEPGYVMLTAWLPGGPSPLPANATHQVGVGAFVVNGAGHVLVVQERTGPAARPGFWKLPTGLANQGEDIADAAVREVLEETGVRTRFAGIIGFRQAHGMAFDKSDLFFLCALTLEDPGQTKLTPQESEIAAAQWMAMSDFSSMPHVKDERTVWGHLNALCRAWAKGTYRGITAVELPVGFRPGSNTVFHGQVDEQPTDAPRAKL